jgi:hypothetical protein
LFETLDAAAAPDLHSQRIRARGQDRLDARHIRRDVADRTGQAIAPFPAVDLVVEELDAGEVTAGAALLLRPVRGRGRGTAGCAILEGDQQVAALEALGGRHGKAAQPERKLLQWRMRVLRLLENEHRTTGQPQLTGEE